MGKLYNPANLSHYERWLPGFKFMDGPVNAVHVVFRAKLDATAEELCEERRRESCLAREWWMSILIPAVHSLLDNTKTRLFNTTATFLRTGILPTYLHIYPDDVPLLNRALDNETLESTIHQHLLWYFVCSKYGQRHELSEGDTLGPEAFGLGHMFDLSLPTRVSVHLAINFHCKDTRYSLLWHKKREDIRLEFKRR